MSERKTKQKERDERFQTNLRDVKKKDAEEKKRLDRQYRSIEEKRLDHERSIES